MLPRYAVFSIVIQLGMDNYNARHGHGPSLISQNIQHMLDLIITELPDNIRNDKEFMAALNTACKHHPHALFKTQAMITSKGLTE